MPWRRPPCIRSCGGSASAVLYAQLRWLFAFRHGNRNNPTLHLPLPNAAFSGWAQELSSGVECFLFEKYLSLPTHGCPRASRNTPAISANFGTVQRFLMNKARLFGDVVSLFVCWDGGQRSGECCRAQLGAVLREGCSMGSTT